MLYMPPDTITDDHEFIPYELPQDLTFWLKLLENEDLIFGIIRDYMEDFQASLSDMTSEMKIKFADFGFQIHYLRDNFDEVEAMEFLILGATFDYGVKEITTYIYKPVKMKLLTDYIEIHQWLEDTDYYSNSDY